ncbi:helix-hairpin-helix domain-containing protein [Microbacter margulisiae]|uniref:DNA uptake protein ComE-like DNA-binding protein n=1 Tax=Microbacter margulisiae TaxID=1350067 RepID=A0A7W5DS10_9PORP|nr:helix-hairpin-helix domain-containing protein [Microbacter margulisiae]MBB3188005.1 DNA uptake protein ComE-like DNA-binding protein [Microbacter margulisiae]
MWKEWFYFTKGQRIGIITLISIIICVMIVDAILPSLFPKHPQETDLFNQQAKMFLDSLQVESKTNHYSNIGYAKSDDKALLHSKEYLPSPILFQFNPNTLDSIGFVKLGLKPYVASNIIKYRLMGGRFHKPNDFAKIWGVTEDKFTELLPYIQIPVEVVASQQTNEAYASIKKKDIILDLNSADTAQLQQIWGVGKGYAKRIVAYRKRLGGYVSVTQLHEIWGMTSETYAQIFPHFTVNTLLINKIRINKASVERLMYHPYLNFTKAKAIYDFRRNISHINNIEDLKNISELDPATLTKISPYLSFD